MTAVARLQLCPEMFSNYMHQSKKKNLENFRRVEQKEHYEVHVSETNPQVEVEVYRLDYVKKKDR